VITNRRPPIMDFASEKTFTMARTWLRDCEENHSGCPKRNTVPRLPTYVIDVCPPLSGVVARLYKARESETAHYLCLSYCWGTTSQYTTVRSNLDDHLKAIPVSKLGLTIQDAIEITRRLGYRYLWVDALYIPQDDYGQKAFEIQSMRSIYKNASVTLSAATASAVSDGFLRTDRCSELNKLRAEQGSKDFDFQITVPGSTAGKLTLAMELEVFQKHPLDNRAWAFQEHYLSARKLIYASTMLQVECREKRSVPLSSSFLHHRDERRGNTPPISTWPWKTPYWTTNFLQLVWDFTNRLLTRNDDRLDAFQGIANEIAEYSGQPVYYGIPTLCSGIMLSWNTSNPAKVRSNRAPSWSWGCLDTIIFIYYYNDMSSKVASEYDAWVCFPDGDLHLRVVVTACVIEGVTWSGNDPVQGGSADHGRCRPDLEAGLPEPSERTYLLMRRNYEHAKRTEIVLIVESIGGGLFRRVGIYYGRVFWDKWTEERREITLV
jgi:hypothetical protein